MPDKPVVPRNGSATRRRWQFSLGGLLGLMTMVCILLAWLSIHRTQFTLTARCGRMPATDDALSAWMQRQSGAANVQISREADVLVVRYEGRKVLPAFRHVLPPLADLGYHRVAEINWAAQTNSPLAAASQWLRGEVTVGVVLALTVFCSVVVYARWRLGRRLSRSRGTLSRA